MNTFGGGMFSVHLARGAPKKQAASPAPLYQPSLPATVRCANPLPGQSPIEWAWLIRGHMLGALLARFGDGPSFFAGQQNSRRFVTSLEKLVFKILLVGPLFP